ncbi:MFS transporter [Verticiella sediminum]|uniref:MFS transporter n=1 Tax=Verticiella sediminum TaxID=1247510 RepID=A0A556A7Z0_9BURK|nr:MFS transporter [Verticiella sediminum]TSH88995.1 MFS transporter [Verticiella sediminum]
MVPSSATPDAGPARWRDLFSGQNALRAPMLAGGVGVHAINVFLATTILPSVVADIGGLDYYAWNTTLFVVASILGAACSTRLLAAQGAQRAYAFAALMFALGSALCALAPSMPVLLSGRVVQGLGGGTLVALSYAMIRLVFDARLWPRAMALVSGMWGIGTLVGPAVGGMYAEFGHWRWAFGTLVPIAGLFAVLARLILPGRASAAPARSGMPWLQLALLTSAVLAVSAGSVHGSVAGSALGIACAAVASLALRRTELRARHRLLPTDALTGRSVLAPLYACMCLLPITVTSCEIFVPLFLQVLHAQSPLRAGYLAALMAAGWTLAALYTAGRSPAGARRALIAAPCVSLVSVAMLAWRMPMVSEGAWPTLLAMTPPMLGVGMGVGLAWPHLLTRVFQHAPAGEEHLASASITTVQLYATAIGAALAGMVANAAGLSDPGGVEGTANAARWLFTAFMAAPALCLLAMLNAVRRAG